MEWSKDVGAARWIVDRLHPFATDLGSTVPEGFPAYARILHPAWRGQWERRAKVRWAALAQAAGTPLEATTRFEELEPSAPPDLHQPPAVGSLDPEELDVLVELLAAFTSSLHSCWFGVWEGYGWMQGSPAVAQAVFRRADEEPRDRPPEWHLPSPPPGPRVQVQKRSLALYSGPIQAATAFNRFPAWQSPNLWWPRDHGWCVASEIDFRSTYLGGTQALVDRVLHDRRLEALPASLVERVTD